MTIVYKLLYSTNYVIVITATIGREEVTTRDSLPVCHRAERERQTTIHSPRP